MKCENCGKKMYEYNFASFRKYEKRDKVKVLLESHDFCSKKCATDFKNKLDSSDNYEIYEITRCNGYYDCEKLGNLRVMCEKKKRVGLSGLLDGFISFLTPECDPAKVGIIKSSVKLLDLMTKFDEKSTKLNNKILEHTKSMNKLTKFILIITGINLFLIAVQIILFLLAK